MDIMTSRPRPLLIGADRYILRAMGRRGIHGVLVYGPFWRDFGPLEVPDCVTPVFTEDESSPEAVLTALTRAGLAEERFSSVITMNEFAVVNASVLAQALGCRGLPSAVAVRFRDKFLQKEAVRVHGIPTARSVVLEDIHEGAPVELPFAAGVVKPATGTATRLTVAVRSTDELRQAVRRFRSEGGPTVRTFVLEEFQQGDEWMVDGVVHDGEIRFASVAEYARPCLTTIETQAPVQIRRFDPATEPWAYELAEPVVRDSLRALGLTDGIFHMELFHHEGQVTFSECGARRGGGLVHEQIECKFGVDLGEAALSVMLGEEPDITVRERPGIVGSTYIPAVSGLLFDVPSREEIMSLPNVEYVTIPRPVGSATPVSISDTVKRLGQVMIRTETLQDFHKRSEEVLAWLDDRIKVVPADLRVKDLYALQPALGRDNSLLASYRRQDG